MVHQILSTPWLAVVVILSGVFLLGMMALTIWGDRGLLAMWRMQQDLQRMAREIEVLEQENNRLGREVQRLQTDLGYIEKIAREELGMVRPGEIVLEFSD
jgi:cell division protein FtsB